MSSSRESSEVGRRTFLKGAAAGAVGLGLAGGIARDVIAKDEATAPKMAMRVFGRTKREVSVIGVGCGGLVPEKVGLLKAAVKNGVNFIDTAWSYGQGNAELCVGEFLKDYPDREKLFVNTKASGFKVPARASDKDTYEALKERLLESLARLKTDYVDCLMWPHAANSPEAVRNEAVQNAMRKLREEGLVRFFGTSSHTNYAATMEAAVEDGFYDVLLTVINVCTQNPEQAGTGGRRGIEDMRKFLKRAKEKDIAVMAMKVAKEGFLGSGTDALLAAQFKADSKLSRYQKLYTSGMNTEGVHTVVIGMTEVLHVREGVAVGQV